MATVGQTPRLAVSAVLVGATCVFLSACPLGTRGVDAGGSGGAGGGDVTRDGGLGTGGGDAGAGGGDAGTGGDAGAGVDAGADLDAGADGGANPDGGMVLLPAPWLQDVRPAEVQPGPTGPASEDGAPFGGPAAPLMSGVQYVPNRDSALVVVPPVAGAQDYRVFRLPAGARVTTVGPGEQVSGTVVHCAGFRQRNDAWSGVRELVPLVEVTDLTQPTVLVVEALASPCPFPGPLAPTHADLRVTIDEVPVEDRITFSLFTEVEVRARFGSLVRNGHGRGAGLAQPGPATPPVVLARTTVSVTPLGRGAPRTADFFDDFDGTSGPLVARGATADGNRTAKPGRQLSNTKWDFFIFNDEADQGSVFETRGTLHVTLPDWGQDVFASVVAVPRLPAALSDTSYLHLTFEVSSNATSRRYWWVGLCGAAQAGQTFDAQRHFTGHLVNTPFFYQPDGLNVSLEGWNCLQFFPRDGAPFPLGPARGRTESDLRVMVNLADAGLRENVVNVSPPQYPANEARPGWFLQRDGQGALGAPVLTDQLLIAPRTRFDAWVRRDRLVLYVNGQQRVCNDFGSSRLTMAEAAVAVGQVLYHSAAERLEFARSFNLRTGQRYYLENLPYVDEREWDNVGFQAGVAAPADFEPARCYEAP